MGFLTRFTQGELRLTRLEAFSDGVFAIIVTIVCRGFVLLDRSWRCVVQRAGSLCGVSPYPALFYRPSYKAQRCLTRLPTCQVCEGEATSES
jgi:hypothetical protein